MAERSSDVSNRLTLDRLMAFSDGVIAIAITILILGIDIPQDHPFSTQGLIGFLHQIEHDVVVYAASFGIIATFWLQHHALFLYLRYCNRAVIWLNTLFLFFLTLIPFLAKLKFTYEHEPKIVLLFGAGSIVPGLVLLGIWRYALSRPHLQRSPPIKPAVIRSMTQRILITPVISLVAICLSFVDVRLGTHAFIIIPFCYLSHRLVDTQWDKPEEASG
jgi:uncharacterized membrane protein